MDQVAPWGQLRLARSLSSALLLLALVALGYGQPPPSEYEVKAAFLLNFTKFIEWPPDAHPPGSPFTLCILGDDPFGPLLDRVIEGEHVSGRKLTVRRVREADPSCAVVFVGKSRGLLPRVADVPRGVLTVGETDDFLRKGGVIAFAIENRRVRFDVDHGAALRAGLKISSKLLNVARMVVK